MPLAVNRQGHVVFSGLLSPWLFNLIISDPFSLARGRRKIQVLTSRNLNDAIYDYSCVPREDGHPRRWATVPSGLSKEFHEHVLRPIHHFGLLVANSPPLTKPVFEIM